MATSVACLFESAPSGDDLEGACKARSERALKSHVQEARGLELTRALLRADVDRVERAIARERGDLVLGVLVVPGDEHVEGLAGDLALGQRAREGGVKRLHEARTRGEACELVRGGAVGRYHEPVEGFVDGICDVDDDLLGELVGELLDGAASVRVVHGEDDHLALDRIAGDGRFDGALSADVASDSFGSPRVFSYDCEVMAARQQAAADAPGHVAGADQRYTHRATRLSVRGRSWRCRPCGGSASP